MYETEENDTFTANIFQFIKKTKFCAILAFCTGLNKMNERKREREERRSQLALKDPYFYALTTTFSQLFCDERDRLDHAI